MFVLSNTRGYDLLSDATHHYKCSRTYHCKDYHSLNENGEQIIAGSLSYTDYDTLYTHRAGIFYQDDTIDHQNAFTAANECSPY